MQVFDIKDYREFILLRGRNWGEMGKMSDAAGCKASYLSRVAKGDTHLTPDHAYGLCRYFNFTALETEYFLLLVDRERANSKTLRAYIERRIEEIKAKNLDIAKTLQRKEPASERYYSAWYFAAIHILTSIADYQNVDAIAKKLMLPETLVLKNAKRASTNEASSPGNRSLDFLW